ncbi:MULTISPECIES: hypothetical protein [Enterobacter]|uniref:hypothetical protein n=1 Tax=Enterobacter vonholyi TaxID=2797505 RepID=UPI002DB8A0D7|nr:hypothetical protein [Enterobacter vonholyi]MEB5981522.1 hypothetical protein [Enterobacter vonholyi]
MLRPPISEVLYFALLHGDLAALDAIGKDRPEDMIHLRTILCTNEPGAVDINLGLGPGLAENEQIISFF